MTHKQRKPYKPHTPKPKPIPVYTLPPSHMFNDEYGFVINCPSCGKCHEHGPIKYLRTDQAIKMSNWCKALLKPPKRIDTTPKLYKLAGPIPPKYRATYEGSECATLDTAISNVALKRARALSNKADKLKRALARERRLATKGMTHNESKSQAAYA